MLWNNSIQIKVNTARFGPERPTLVNNRPYYFLYNKFQIGQHSWMSLKSWWCVHKAGQQWKCVQLIFLFKTKDSEWDRQQALTGTGQINRRGWLKANNHFAPFVTRTIKAEFIFTSLNSQTSRLVQLLFARKQWFNNKAVISLPLTTWPQKAVTPWRGFAYEVIQERLCFENFWTFREGQEIPARFFGMAAHGWTGHVGDCLSNIGCV